jgi:hypothetical protein
MSAAAPVNQIVPRPKAKAAGAPSANSIATADVVSAPKRQRLATGAAPSETAPPIVAVPTVEEVQQVDAVVPQQHEEEGFSMQQSVPTADDDPMFVELGFSKAIDEIEQWGENETVPLVFQPNPESGIDSNYTLNILSVKWALNKRDPKTTRKTMTLTGAIPLKQPFVPASRLTGIYRPENKFAKK